MCVRVCVCTCVFCVCMRAVCVPKPGHLRGEFAVRAVVNLSRDRTAAAVQADVLQEHLSSRAGTRRCQRRCHCLAHSPCMPLTFAPLMCMMVRPLSPRQETAKGPRKVASHTAAVGGPCATSVSAPVVLLTSMVRSISYTAPAARMRAQNRIACTHAGSENSWLSSTQA